MFVIVLSHKWALLGQTASIKCGDVASSGLRGSDAGRDVEPNLSLDGQRLQRDGLAWSADEGVGTEIRSKGHFRRRAESLFVRTVRAPPGHWPTGARLDR